MTCRKHNIYNPIQHTLYQPYATCQILVEHFKDDMTILICMGNVKISTPTFEKNIEDLKDMHKKRMSTNIENSEEFT